MSDGWKAVVAMVCITMLAVCAMLKDLDGAIFWPACVIVSGLGGYALRGKSSGEKKP